MKLERIVILTGVDGSGKTKHARILASEYIKSGVKCRYVWMRSAYFFSLPFMAICRVLGFTKIHKLQNNSSHSEHVYNIRPIVFIWPWIQLADAIIYVATKIYMPLIQGYRLVVDRFVYDILVDLMVDVNDPILYKSLLGQLMLALVPNGAATLLFDIDEATALRRKTDIPNECYLKVRRKNYVAIADYLKIAKIDSSDPIKIVHKQLLKRLKEARSELAMKHIEKQLRNRMQARARWKKWKKGPVALFRKLLNRSLSRLIGRAIITKAESGGSNYKSNSRQNKRTYFHIYIDLLKGRGLKIHTVILVGSRAKNRWTPRSDVDTIVIASGLPKGVPACISRYTRANLLSDMPYFLGIEPYGCTKEEFVGRLQNLDLLTLDAVYCGKIMFDDGFWLEVRNRFREIEEKYGLPKAYLERKLSII